MNKNKLEHIFFIGAGGVGISALAELTFINGSKVSGSDVATNAYTQHLVSLGIKIYYGHRAANLDRDVTLVVFSSAVDENNPERIEARSRGIKEISRGEYLALAQESYHTLAVAGAHGKTSTSSMLAWILKGVNIDVSFLIGGKLINYDSNCRVGKSDILVVETDESDGSFLHFTPEIAIITSFDSEHLSYYGSLEGLKRAFNNYASKVQSEGGQVIFNGDDPVLREIISGISVGIDNCNDYVVSNPISKGSRSTYELNGNLLEVPLIGDHMIINSALALVASTMICGTISCNGYTLANFPGIMRRLELLKRDATRELYTDYAHHPTEVEATLKALRVANPKREITVIYQPHRYSRTEQVLCEYRACFKDANKVLLTEIYSAGENPVANLNSVLFDTIKHDCKIYSEDVEYLIETALKDGEIVVCMGAGSIDKIARGVKQKFE